MSTIKILFRKEVDVDLNAYYPNLPAKLRREVDDAVYKLLGGGQKASSDNLRKAEYFRRTGKVPHKQHNTLTSRMVNALPMEKLFTKDEFKTIVGGTGVPWASTHLSNLIRAGWIEVAK